jgi:CheY-like chemotaxis protein
MISSSSQSASCCREERCENYAIDQKRDERARDDFSRRHCGEPQAVGRSARIAGGYATAAAASSEEVLAKIARIKPNLVSLVVMMPGINGYEVCKQVRANPENGILPVVMVTALDPTQERVKGLEAGADDFVSKPINRTELAARVKSLLRIKHFNDTEQQ